MIQDLTNSDFDSESTDNVSELQTLLCPVRRLLGS